MSTAATTATNDATKPDATATSAPTTNTPAPAAPDKGQAAPAAADPKPGTDPAAPAADPAPDAGADVGDDDVTSLLDEVDDDGAAADKAPAADAKPDGDKATDKAEPAKDDKPADKGWVKIRDEAADRFIKKIEKKLSTDKDGKPLSARQRQANIDDAREKFLAKLARYPSMTEALIAGIAAQDKISSGKYKAPLAEDATDEEVAAWRKENGIPEDAAGYKLPKVQGQEWTDADKPGLDKLLGRLHEKNASQAQVDAVLATYKELVSEAQEAQKEKLRSIDREDTQATREALREEFEGEFKPAMTLLKRLVDDAEVFPDDAGKVLAAARDPETGKRLINNPAIARFLINFARDRYGEGSMVTGDQQAVMNTEEADLIKLRDTNIDEYMHRPWKNTGMTGSERLLEIMRRKEASGRGRRAA